MRESLSVKSIQKKGATSRPASALASLSLPVAEVLEKRLFLDRTWIPAGIDANAVDFNCTTLTTDGDDIINIFVLQVEEEEDDDDDGGGGPGGGGDDEEAEIDLDGDGEDDAGRIVVYVRSPNGTTVYLAEEDTPEFVIWGRGGNDTIVVDEVLPEVMDWMWQNVSPTIIFPGIGAVGEDTAKEYVDAIFSIDAGSGDDLVVARCATDLGDSGDTIWGGSGRDTLYGTTGADVIQAEQGADTIYAGMGADHVTGGRGADYISAENSIWSPFTHNGVEGGQDDTVNGGRGNDTLIGDMGPDVLMGGRGNDMIVANARFDYNQGAWVTDSWGSANDANHARIYGGAGNDTAFVDSDMEEVLASLENVGVRLPPATLLYPMPGIAL